MGRRGTVFKMDGEDAVRPQIQTEGRGRREQSRGCMADAEITFVSHAEFATLTLSNPYSFFPYCPKTCLCAIELSAGGARYRLETCTDTWRPAQNVTSRLTGQRVLSVVHREGAFRIDSQR